jgi:uncharacterized protein with HEPN domain
VTRHELRATDYLQHILDAIDRAVTYVSTFEVLADFEMDGMAQDAVVRNLEIIGEAAVKLERVAADKIALSGDIPWKLMRTMRNKVIHDYFEVDVGLVWSTAKNDLPALKQQIAVLLASLQGGCAEEPDS